MNTLKNLMTALGDERGHSYAYGGSSLLVIIIVVILILILI